LSRCSSALALRVHVELWYADPISGSENAQAPEIGWA
jgi:hypothetical protein